MLMFITWSCKVSWKLIESLKVKAQTHRLLDWSEQVTIFVFSLSPSSAGCLSWAGGGSRLSTRWGWGRWWQWPRRWWRPGRGQGSTGTWPPSWPPPPRGAQCRSPWLWCQKESIVLGAKRYFQKKNKRPMHRN